MGKPIRIQLVDGYAVVRDALRALIATTPDMEVVGEASDGEEAIDQATLFEPDVTILDPFTIEGGSMNIAASLLRIFPQTRILVLTNEANEQDILAAIEAGVTGYLIKGATAPEILRAIRGLHRGKFMFDASITNILT